MASQFSLNMNILDFVIFFFHTEQGWNFSTEFVILRLSVIWRKSAAAAAAATARKAPMAKSWQRSSPPPPPYCNDYICESESVRCEINVKFN